MSLKEISTTSRGNRKYWYHVVTGSESILEPAQFWAEIPAPDQHYAEGVPPEVQIWNHAGARQGFPIQLPIAFLFY